ncbi:hypothetical protein [Methanogenium cariaci]|uniref:hypothetical protein n=1 Tax=Methanogenium cariaci TaxID=2197 RepID=UPI000783787F|nr:hypothetical protein [Methanogenium cariaci]
MTSGPPPHLGDRIVWTDMRNGNADIYIYTISTGEETVFTTDTGDQTVSDIFRDQVLWTDTTSGELRLSNLTSGTDRVVSGGTSWKMGGLLFLVTGWCGAMLPSGGQRYPG